MAGRGEEDRSKAVLVCEGDASEAAGQEEEWCRLVSVATGTSGAVGEACYYVQLKPCIGPYSANILCSIKWNCKKSYGRYDP